MAKQKENRLSRNAQPSVGAKPKEGFEKGHAKPDSGARSKTKNRKA